jgi:hypothetical protein
MRKAHKNKIRATFYIDKDLYQLLKRCSAIEGIPMSSILNDDILQQRVGEYYYPDPDHANACFPGDMEELDNKKRDLYYEHYENSAEGKRAARLLAIEKMLETNRITEKEAIEQKAATEKTFQEALKIEKEEYEKSKKELHDRWVKAVKDFPIEKD